MRVQRKMKREAIITTLCPVDSKSEVFYSSLYVLNSDYRPYTCFSISTNLIILITCIKMSSISKVLHHKLPILTIQTHWQMITFHLKSIKNRMKFIVEISSSLHLNITFECYMQSETISNFTYKCNIHSISCLDIHTAK